MAEAKAQPPLPFGAVLPRPPGPLAALRRPWAASAAVLLVVACAVFVVSSSEGGASELLQGPQSATHLLMKGMHGQQSGRPVALVARPTARGARLQDDEYGYGDEPEEEDEGYDEEEEEPLQNDWGIDYGTDDTAVNCADFGVCGDGAYRPPECPCAPEPPAPPVASQAPPTPDPNTAGNEAAAATLDPVEDELKKEEEELMEAKDFETMGVVREAELVLRKAEGEFTRREAEAEEEKLKEEIPALEAKNNTAAIKIIEDVVEALVVAEKVKTGVAAMVAGNHTPPGVTLAPPASQQPVWQNPPSWYMQPPWWAQYPYNQTGQYGPQMPYRQEPPSWWQVYIHLKIYITNICTEV
jgi:hypothetical protein